MVSFFPSLCLSFLRFGETPKGKRPAQPEAQIKTKKKKWSTNHENYDEKLATYVFFFKFDFVFFFFFGLPASTSTVHPGASVLLLMGFTEFFF